ncbi:MAG: hypothetical protein PVF43_08650 [Candidatus Eiseniibacteriota bacterium]|jgi:hypothetical protein
MRQLLCIACLLLVGSLAQAEVDIDNNVIGSNIPENQHPVIPTVESLTVQTFDNEADFLAAAGPVETEDLEDEPLIGDCNAGGQTMITLDTFVATSTPAALKIPNVDCTGAHNTTAGGQKYLLADTDMGGVSAAVTFTLNAATNAFGMYATDLDSNSLQLTINGLAYTIPPHGNGGQGYFGIVSDDAITSISMVIVPDFDSSYGFDDISVGVAATPIEATTWGTIKAVHR